MELILAYIAGLLTLINPCVLPVLPIVLASSLQSNRLGPLALTAGLALSFVASGMIVAAFGPALGLESDTVARAGGLVMAAFGLVLLVPRLQAGFATATAGLSAGADARIGRKERAGLTSQALGGALLGLVWVPCVGPTLGGAIALAATGRNLAWAGAIMAAFALGVATVMLALAYGAQSALRSRRDALRRLAGRARPAMGAAFLLVGAAIWFNWLPIAEGWLLDHTPIWMQDLSVRY
ncbi:MAG: cytochrome c biogenesis protein CcdA [Limimaricola sp.]|uniref:cytochrome c biogenesis CcdA family protein n=1 Tax=Limimaricola sp. TaxID=2211665 RepID=UPI001DB794DA|nr:cytochrome c biogenesis CcdA family protein [Limimaricola sp.]MBI1417087.1 cytochrome c biogenesis protein CcdA [Limimaricola sp.]